MSRALDHGQVSCWGSNGEGQLGDDSPPDLRALPGPIPLAGAVNEIAAVGIHACAVTDRGALTTRSCAWAGTGA